jgi:hypothetical protein
MARTNLNKNIAQGPYGAYGAGAADLTMQAGDVANMNQFTAGGNDLIIAQNSGAAPYTITITSSPDRFGRTKDITNYSLATGAIAAFGPIYPDGWIQSDGKIYLSVSNASVKIAVLALPG